MNRMARDPDGRVEIFTETANRRGISPVIVEKDFWVCWTLGQVFENPEESPSFLFKGGTSLSKVFNAIQRFSEDIDLSINRHDLGFEDERDPARATTRSQQETTGGIGRSKNSSYSRGARAATEGAIRRRPR